MREARPLALVTGGGRRLGATIGAALARAGHDLAIHCGSHHPDPEPALLAAVAEAGVESETFLADLADPEAVAGLLPAVAAKFGRSPAVLVNNASRFDYDSSRDARQAGLLDHYAVNTAAPVLLSQALAAAGQAAVIVNILDQRIAAPNGDQFSYTLSKLALSEATEILARDFAPQVRVCAVAPGLTLSGPDIDGARLAAAARHMPLARLPEPAEIAEAVLYLVRAGAVTGQTIFVDSGAHLCRYARDFPFLDDEAC